MSISALNPAASNDVTGYAAPASNTAGTAKADPVVSTGTTAAPAKPATKTEIEDAVTKLNAFAANSASDLNFSTDKETGLTIVKVVDTATDKVIRQIPSEEAVSIARSIDKLQGLLIDHKA